MPALAIAPAAGGHLVLDPGRPALDLGHQVIGGRLNQDGERPAAPHAPATVSDQHGLQSLGAILVAQRPASRHPDSGSSSAAISLSTSPENSRRSTDLGGDGTTLTGAGGSAVGRDTAAA